MTEDARQSALPGSLRARYRIRHKLGEGGFGEVLLADDVELDRLAAIKLLKGSLPDLVQRQRFEREARLTAALRHPHVVELYDHGVEDDGTAWIVYEFIDGRSLDQRIVEGALPEEELVPLIEQLAGALDAAHRAGMIHRDVKPHNVMLRADGSAVLCDFGLARPEEKGSFVTAEGLVLGTPAYLSPEVFRGATPSPASDQFALAATAYACLYRRTVYRTSEVGEILRQLSGDWPPPVPPPGEAGHPTLDAALRRALDPDPDRRFDDCAGLAAGLRESPRLAETRVVERAPESPLEPPRPPGEADRPRSRVLPVLLAAGCLALVAVLGLPGGEPAPPPSGPTEAIRPVAGEETRRARQAIEELLAELIRRIGWDPLGGEERRLKRVETLVEADMAERFSELLRRTAGLLRIRGDSLEDADRDLLHRVFHGLLAPALRELTWTSKKIRMVTELAERTRGRDVHSVRTQIQLLWESWEEFREKARPRPGTEDEWFRIAEARLELERDHPQNRHLVDAVSIALGEQSRGLDEWAAEVLAYRYLEQDSRRTCEELGADLDGLTAVSARRVPGRLPEHQRALSREMFGAVKRFIQRCPDRQLEAAGWLVRVLPEAAPVEEESTFFRARELYDRWRTGRGAGADLR